MAGMVCKFCLPSFVQWAIVIWESFILIAVNHISLTNYILIGSVDQIMFVCSNLSGEVGQAQSIKLSTFSQAQLTKHSWSSTVGQAQLAKHSWVTWASQAQMGMFC